MDKQTVDKHFYYEDGKLFRRATCKEAGYTNDEGYRHVSLEGKQYKTHRLIFLMHNGYMPKIVDHINGINDDNYPTNLRECSHTQNQYNSKTPKTNTSGGKGVCWDKQRTKWKASLRINGKVTHLGYFTDLQLAALTVQRARALHHKDFANHG